MSVHSDFRFASHPNETTSYLYAPSAIRLWCKGHTPVGYRHAIFTGNCTIIYNKSWLSGMQATAFLYT